ncbi:hypothetical protein G9A89_013879 [Geosiphon pyriformis]|nr:hypothetical protein G9A89_013879 [Geosiphon pyriformis]
MSEKNKQYKILVAAENSPISFKAIKYGFDLCSRFNTSYSLTIIYIVALNYETNIPILHNLDRANNIDIIMDAKETTIKLEDHLKRYHDSLPSVKYSFLKHEGHGTVGKILQEYIEKTTPDLNLLVVGSRNLEGLQKIVLSSTSEYLAKHLHCPIVIVKS